MAPLASTFPKIIAFDLDYTLWPFYVELQFTKPYRMIEGNVMVDANDFIIKYYSEVPQVLEKLSTMNVELAAASRTSEIEGANTLLDMFGWRKYFKYFQIYTGCKIAHFTEIQKDSGVPFSDMLFFDDEKRNIVDVSTLGVTCYYVRDGMTLDVLDKGLNLFKARSIKQNGM